MQAHSVGCDHPKRVLTKQYGIVFFKTYLSLSVTVQCLAQGTNTKMSVAVQKGSWDHSFYHSSVLFYLITWTILNSLNALFTRLNSPDIPRWWLLVIWKREFPRNVRYIISHPISVQEGDGSLFLPDFNVGTFSGTDRWKDLSSNKSIDQVMWYNLLQSVTTLVRNPSRHSGGLKKGISNF